MSKNYYKDVGYNFAEGVLTCFGKYVILAIIIGMIYDYYSPIGDCDKGAWQRCGMMVAIDNKTGKEYLLSRYGGIIERAKP